MTAKRDPFDNPRRHERASEAPTGIDPELVEDLGAQLGAERAESSELEAAREEAARNLATAQRWQADFENYRKRQERDLADMRTRAGERIVSELLPVLDDLDRAIDHTVTSMASGAELEHLLKGVEMVRTRILGVFEKEGVSVIDPFGELFDPNLHNAVGQREDLDLPDHTVVEVYQRGYLLGGRVIRPAMVLISTGGPAPTVE
jgi:molecular chaperone GrpE